VNANQGNVSDVVPDVSEAVVTGHSKCSLETVERHVVLLRIEATQAEIVEDLGIVDSHL